MHLLNAAVVATSALVGTAGAAAAYGAMNTTPIQPPPAPEQATMVVYSPCEPPSVLKGDTCLTTVVKTVVKKAKPKVITIVERPSPSKHKSASHTAGKKHHEHEGEDGDHDDDHGDDDDHGGDHGGDDD